jgi:hypothetical protein
MLDTVPVRPADLLIDEVNPRLDKPNVGQREAQRALARDQQRKLQKLAKDIVEYGLNPLELPVVAPTEDGRYIVLEGNRRLTALKALENPDSIAEAVDAGILKEMRKLSKRYHDNPIDYVECFLVKDRDQVEHWLDLKHTGWNEGAGVVTWNPDEAARFKARAGVLEPHTQALDFLTRQGYLTLEARRNVKTTTFQRLMEQPVFRDHIGLELKNKKLFFRADQDRVAKALMYVVEHLPPVREIDKREDQIAWVKDKLPSRFVVKATIESGKGTALTEATVASGDSTKKTVIRPQRQRERLIPSDCVLNVTDARVKTIEAELRRLNVQKFSNAAAVLLRVFIELSADCYVIRSGLTTSPDASLGKKIGEVATDLVSKRKLTSQQAKPVNRAVSSDAFLATSVKLMNDYVHNQHTFPAPGDLLASWNSLQPFITAMWSA